MGGDYNECLAGGLGCGTVYELTKSDNWAVNTLHAFTSGADGQYPGGGVVLDQAGNVYGTVPENNFQDDGGDVFELTPSGSGWTFDSLFQFSCDDDGCAASAGLLFDQAGNLTAQLLAGDRAVAERFFSYPLPAVVGISTCFSALRAAVGLMVPGRRSSWTPPAIFMAPPQLTARMEMAMYLS